MNTPRKTEYDNNIVYPKCVCTFKYTSKKYVHYSFGTHSQSEKNTLFQHFVFACALRMINRRFQANHKIFLTSVPIT